MRGAQGPSGTSGSAGSAGTSGSSGQNGSMSGNLTTKGDLEAHDGSQQLNLSVGTNGQVLTANSAATYGLSWEDGMTTGKAIAMAIVFG